MPVSTSGPQTDEQLTIDQLAQRTGISVRTIRFYTQRGLLRPPQLRGRTGLYGEHHLARLELVSELSALGFTLAAIEEQLRRLPAGAGSAELALHRALLTPWLPEQLEELDREQLDRRAGRPLSPADLTTLEGLGILTQLDGDRVRLHGSGTLSGGMAVLDSHLPGPFLRLAHELIERHANALADELMELFQREVLQPYRDRGRPAAERGRLAEALTQLKPVTVRGVMTAFGRAVNRTIREKVS